MSGATALPGATSGFGGPGADLGGVLQKLLGMFGGNRAAAAAFLQGKPSGLPYAMQQMAMGAIGYNNVPLLLNMLGVPAAAQAPGAGLAAPGGFGGETDPASVGLAGNPGGTYPGPTATPTPATPAASPTAPGAGATGAGLPPLFNLGSETSPQSAGLPANPGGVMTTPTATTTPTGGLGGGNNSIYGAYLGTQPDKLERAVLQAMGADPDRLGQYGGFLQGMIHPLVQASAEFLPYAQGTGNNGMLDPTGVQGWAQHFADQMRTPGVDAFAAVRDWIGKVVGGAGFQDQMNKLPDQACPACSRTCWSSRTPGRGGCARRPRRRASRN
jgi:hypothetical protein